MKWCPNCNIVLIQDAIKVYCPACPFNAPHNTKKITELFAYVSVDPKTGLEGLIGIEGRGGVMMAAVSTNRVILEECKDVVRRIKNATGMSSRLIRFEIAEVLEEI